MSELKVSVDSSQSVNIIDKSISNLVNEPYKFVSADSELKEKTLGLTEELYSFARSQDLHYPLVHYASYQKEDRFGLECLITEGFDHDQIWQQLQLRNDPFFKELAGPLIKNLLGEEIDDDSEEGELEGDEEGSEDMEDSEEMEMGEEEEASDEEEISNEEEVGNKMEEDSEMVDIAEQEGLEAGQEDDEDDEEDDEEEMVDEDDYDRTEVDDDFFSLHRMHKMVEDAEEKELNPEQDKEEDDDDESIDYFQDPDNLDSDEDDVPVEEAKFTDFFAPPTRVPLSSRNDKKSRKVKFEEFDEEEQDQDEEQVLPAPRQLLEEDDEDVEGKEKMSRFEQKQAKLAKVISQLEDEIVAPKAWTMMGETTAKSRPLNSLLEEDLEFDNASKPVPVVTVEVTQSLEELIKQRILSNEFNDVVAPPKVSKRLKFTPDMELDMEKSKKSLAEIYEDEYIKATKPGQAENDLPPELAKAHNEIDELFQSVCTKLDALAHAHYTPKMPKLEVQVIKDVAAITMEDAVPMAVSNATLLAPEEVYAQTTHGEAGRVHNPQELSKEERTTLRNRKKRLAKLRNKSQPAKPVDTPNSAN